MWLFNETLKLSKMKNEEAHQIFRNVSIYADYKDGKCGFLTSKHSNHSYKIYHLIMLILLEALAGGAIEVLGCALVVLYLKK